MAAYRNAFQLEPQRNEDELPTKFHYVGRSMQIANCKSQINFASRNLHSVDQAVAVAIKCSLTHPTANRYPTRYIDTDTSAQYKCVCQEIHEKENPKCKKKKLKSERGKGKRCVAVMKMKMKKLPLG